VPLVGLTIDAGIMYAVHAKLSAACDAAALAGARELTVGADPGTQKTNATNKTKQYLALNFPSGYFGTGGANVDSLVVDDTLAHERTVTLQASVAVNTIFMRWLRVSSLTLSSKAQAVRRDVNLVLVMDKSTSLQRTGSCQTLKDAAANFVQGFAEGRDHIGLVTFGSDTSLPTPDFPVSTDFSSLPTTIENITCNGSTATALGLYSGYSQLVQLGQPDALNVMLLFTDGQPTDIQANFPKATSCTNTEGTMLAVGVTHNGTWTATNVTGIYYPNNGGSTVAGNFCSYPGTSDVAYIPNTDLYGSSINSGFQPFVANQMFGSTSTAAKVTNLMNASFNAADSMGLRIRHGGTLTAVAAPYGTGVSGSLSGIVSYSIGLGNDGMGSDTDDLLARFANDNGSGYKKASNYESTYASGLYVRADDASGLADAFSRVQSEILRLQQ